MRGIAEVKESTARFYRYTFLGFFSSEGESRKRRYHPSVVAFSSLIGLNYALDADLLIYS